MKKLLTVLLVAVLAAGFVFAGLTGDATLGAEFNLDNKVDGFANGTSLKGTFALNLGKEDLGSVGEGKIYAEIAATYTVDVKIGKTEGATPIKPTPALSSEFKITKANIHFGEDFVVGILGAGGGQSYAASYYLKDGDPEVDKVSMGEELAPGFTASYKGFAGGFGLEGDADANTYKVFGQAETPEFKFVEDALTLQAAGYGKLADNDKAFGAALKAGYKSDAFSFKAAADVLVEAKNDIRVEAALNGAFAPVTLDVFYHNVGAQNLDAKIALALGNISLYVDGRNLIVAARSLEVGAEAKLDVFTVKGSFGLAFDTMVSTIKADVNYAHDMFTVKANTELGIDLDAAAGNVKTVKVGASIESAKLIDKATVSLGWSGADFIAKKYGAINATCKIAF
ncbi:MAG: hypothetical protein SO135_02215 [Sphaerochaetaceae bacterium]|nr:hypothetical protein [Sphaerochaetaceae bacterium]